MLEFGRGASNQTVAPGTTRSLHATGPQTLLSKTFHCFSEFCSCSIATKIIYEITLKEVIKRAKQSLLLDLDFKRFQYISLN